MILSAVTPSISENDPRLTTDILTVDPTADAYAPQLQSGLCRIEGKEIRIKPEIASKLSYTKTERISQLLISGRHSEANNYAACHLLNKVLEECPDGHEASKVSVWCGKVFLCGDCAQPGSRTHQFHYEHPYLYEKLLHSPISVLTFTIPPESKDSFSYISPRPQLDKGQALFEQFISQFSCNDHGWKFLAAFSFEENDHAVFQRTKFFAIHCGPKLPAQPELARLWREVAGGKASLKVKLYDGRDGDQQIDGIRLAHSGFVEYHEALRDLDGWPYVDYSQEFKGYSTTKLYGSFYGFDKREERVRAANPVVELCEHGEEHSRASKCSKCGKEMVVNNALPLMTNEEFDRRYESCIVGHSKRAIYGRVSRVASTSNVVAPSPPPW